MLRRLVCPLSTPSATGSPTAAWSPTDQTRSSWSNGRPATLTASSRARRPQTCRCRRLPSTSWSSTSRPPKRSASPCHPRFSPAPTRWSN